MEIHKLELDNFKQFHRFRGDFGHEELSSFSIKFLIGNNGSGKSSVMQAIGLIFTRAFNDESPGFNYELVYSITKKNGEKVYILLSNNSKYNLTERLYIRTSENLNNVYDGKVIQSRYSEQVDLHPRRIISFTSGPNNSLEEVLVNSPLASITSDLFDELSKQSSDASKLVYLGKLRNQLLYEPNYLNIDTDNATFILAALILTAPMSRREKRGYFKKRLDLFQMVKSFTPVSVTFKFNESSCRKLLKDGQKSFRYINRLREFLERFDSYSRVTIEHGVDNLSQVFRTITLPFMNTSSFGFNTESNEMNLPETMLKDTPVEFLTLMIIAQRLGYLHKVHIQFQHTGNDRHVLDENSLSDGEFLWLTRMGLVIITQQEHDENTLFLFDEPDVFLNEQWTMQFVNMLHQFSEIHFDNEIDQKKYNQQEFWIATHSTLMLTDAFQKQTYFIETPKENEGSYEAKLLHLSTFGADRGEVSAQLFMGHDRIGEYAKRLIEGMMSDAVPINEINKVIQKLGPGYERFRLEEYWNYRKRRSTIGR